MTSRQDRRAAKQPPPQKSPIGTPLSEELRSKRGILREKMRALKLIKL
jgi:hypothetical protein